MSLVNLTIRPGISNFKELIRSYRINEQKYVALKNNYKAPVYNALFSDENRQIIQNRLNEQLESNQITETPDIS